MVGLNEKLGWLIESLVAIIMFICLLVTSSYYADKLNAMNVTNSNLVAGIVFGFFTTFGWLLVVPLAYMGNDKKSNNNANATPKEIQPPQNDGIPESQPPPFSDF